MWLIDSGEKVGLGIYQFFTLINIRIYFGWLEIKIILRGRCDPVDYDVFTNCRILKIFWTNNFFFAYNFKLFIQINETIPETSLYVSKICNYWLTFLMDFLDKYPKKNHFSLFLAILFTTIMLLSGLQMIANVFVLVFHHKNVKIQEPMPEWVSSKPKEYLNKIFYFWTKYKDRVLHLQSFGSTSRHALSSHLGATKDTNQALQKGPYQWVCLRGHYPGLCMQYECGK